MSMQIGRLIPFRGCGFWLAVEHVKADKKLHGILIESAS